jgi:hypothetical protein
MTSNHLRTFLLSIAMLGFSGFSDIGGLGRFASADDSSRGPVYTEPPQDDPSYWYMGEYMGQVATEDGQSETVGVQIRPTGKGGFDAILYQGGLPGLDGHKRDGTRLVGRLSDNFLILSGGPWAIFAEKDSCSIVDRGGKPLGKLDRVERRSSTLAALPPIDAMVLFDGTGTEQFINGRMTDDGLLMEGTSFKPMHQDFDLHVEFRLPYMPEAIGQQRSNSGVYIQSRYECQILDSFGELPVFNGAGALYRFRAPELNMTLPPLVWQTYDIRFTSPRWAADGTKLRNARVTAWLNGVMVQNDIELDGSTGAGMEETPSLLPTKLQDHSDPVRFRNIWIVDRGLAPTAPFPVEGSGELPSPPEQISLEIAANDAGGETPAEGAETDVEALADANSVDGIAAEPVAAPEKPSAQPSVKLVSEEKIAN